MNKKKIIKIILTIMIVIVIGIGANTYFKVQKLTNEVRDIKINNIDLSKLDDGVYKGEYSFKDTIKARVKLTIKNNKIASIDLIEHKYGLGKKAEVITNRVIDAQSLNVDSVSGATASSTIILKAIENALTKDSYE